CTIRVRSLRLSRAGTSAVECGMNASFFLILARAGAACECDNLPEPDARRHGRSGCAMRARGTARSLTHLQYVILISTRRGGLLPPGELLRPGCRRAGVT